ncbi:alpha-L-fucosidase [Desertivirga xinjiangensis]|uniref:alpha-L-fucosidase n=1 Tax=Desertivirga xinjiangensis TaxID=539206 RepID=UPI00210C4BFD|nr:alpha-L-fucosidase [Pedobacter xinjiangensis]
MIINRKTFAFFTLILITLSSKAQSNDNPRLADFMSKRFGMFIHFGPVTLRGTEIGWSRNKEVSQEDYDSLFREFNPVLFNADAWVRVAKKAGMKYLVITAKHHDGFCLWPTHSSGYNIMSSPFKRDIVGELARACKKHGITLGIYMTVLDWHDPNYPIQDPNDQSKNVPGNMEAFKATMKLQIKELINRYHPYLLWYDGYWEKPWTNEHGREIYKYIKSLDPNIIVNNRLGKESEVLNEHSIGDFLTPEQRIGQLNLNEPWESCITIGQQWAWKPNDKLKSEVECIQTLVRSACGNGNLLFNIGPMMDGRIEGRQIKLLSQVGKWVHKNGESIFNTKGGPYVPNEVFGSTRRKDKIYVHVFKSGLKTIELPAIPDVCIKRIQNLDGSDLQFLIQGKTVKVKALDNSTFTQNTVIVIHIDRDAGQLSVIKL